MESQSQRRLRETARGLSKATKLPSRRRAAAAAAPRRRTSGARASKAAAASQTLPSASQSCPQYHHGAAAEDRARVPAAALPRGPVGVPGLFSRACEHARKVLPPAPKFLPGLPPLMPPPAVRLQTQDVAAGPAPARVHEGAALSDDDDDDGLLPGQAAPGDGFVIVHDPSLTGMPLYCCCMALQRLPAKDALALRATNRAFRERITFLSLALRPPFGVVGRKWDAFKKATKTLPTAEAIKGLERRPGGKQGPVPRALRALLKPFDSKKGSWHRLRRAADACAS